MCTVLQQDVSGKSVERVALYNFAIDNASPHSILVEKYAADRGSSTVHFGHREGGRALRSPDRNRYPSYQVLLDGAQVLAAGARAVVG